MENNFNSIPKDAINTVQHSVITSKNGTWRKKIFYYDFDKGFKKIKQCKKYKLHQCKPINHIPRNQNWASKQI